MIICASFTFSAVTGREKLAVSIAAVLFVLLVCLTSVHFFVLASMLDVV
jgi:hypothetical protein